jgi:hypothetical protein
MFDVERRDFEERLMAVATGLDVSEIRTTIDGGRTSVTFRLDPETLSSAAWALLYALGSISFRAVAGTEPFEDRWSIGDMLDHLLFENGRLFFFAKSVRGREMNTRIEVDQDGDVLIETTMRGTAVVDWVRALLIRGSQAPASG